MPVLSDSTLSGAAASFDIQGIDQTYTNLLIILVTRCDNAVANQLNKVTFNNDTGANYDYEYVYGTTNTALATAGAGTAFAAVGDTIGTSAVANRSAMTQIWLPSYAGTTFHKVIQSQAAFAYNTAGGNLFSQLVMGNWRNTAAINRVTLFPNAGNYIAGSRCTVYGIT